LQQKYHIKKLSTGDMLRAEVESRSHLGNRIRETLDDGKLVSDDVMIELIAGCIAEPECAICFILDGSPRTAPQAEALDKMLSDMGRKIDHVIVLEVDETALMDRMKARVKQTGGARSDDTEETFKNRLGVYRKQTAPVLPYFEGRGLLRKIDGMASVDQVTDAIDKALKKG